MIKENHTAPAFSRPTLVSDLLRDPTRRFDIEADAKERAALAALNGLDDIASFKASFQAVKAGKFIRITGRLKSRLTQQCVVTLEPFESEVAEEIDTRFLEEPTGPAMRAAKTARAIKAAGKVTGKPTGKGEKEERRTPAPITDPMSMDEDEAEEIVDGKIDLGALAGEFLTLALDPYPRKPGATFDLPAEDDGEKSPFSMLGDLKNGANRKKT
ncbi:MULTISPECIES: YceD family protein [unclassified Beijerinckia]|uniref:YceD family protein n=1 Tax=unclassified Beijerinckia TaxID=2638183 RepID=UPI0008966CCE|nr:MULTISPECIES: YceD family protein [unclassified Beijerinckia]MDH7794726.1 uncharacterized metal-binding protein YceD (DUF177 family) [Beijerinckia sp. GAS462]SEB72790.1 Uncharacterized ACR, COG1399 [Beijerinckia sp. 28-YEA-48]